MATTRGDAIRLVKSAIEAAGVAIPDTTYRIRLEGAGLAPAAATQPQLRREPPSPAAADSKAQAIHPSEEKALPPSWRLNDQIRRTCLAATPRRNSQLERVTRRFPRRRRTKASRSPGTAYVLRLRTH